MYDTETSQHSVGEEQFEQVPNEMGYKEECVNKY